MRQDFEDSEESMRSLENKLRKSHRENEELRSEMEAVNNTSRSNNNDEAHFQ